MRRSRSMPAWTALALTLTATTLLAFLVVVVTTVKATAPAAPDYRVVRLGGLEYEAMLGRPLDPANAVDRGILAGLPAAQLRPRPGKTLYGAFISIANDSAGPIPSARSIELRDDAGRVFRPLALPRSNPYAYTPRSVPGRTRMPAYGTPADDNLAATGELVLFRIPRWEYDNGVLELVIHSPNRPAQTASLTI